MVPGDTKHRIAREFAALTHWLERLGGQRRNGEGEWGDHFPLGGDVPLSPTPRVDLYRNREKLVLPPRRAE